MIVRLYERGGGGSNRQKEGRKKAEVSRRKLVRETGSKE